MISRYTDGRGLRRYLAGAAAARAGDEMSGPALLLLGFAVTGRPGTGSGLLASLTVAGAAGGPLFGALLDRSRRPDRLLAWTLVAYALGIVAVQAAAGRLPMPALVAIALFAGLFNPAGTGGRTPQLPPVGARRQPAPGSALDAPRASDQRDRGRLADRQRDPGPSPAPQAPGSTAPVRARLAGHLGVRQHAGDRGEHGRGGAGAGLAHAGRGRPGRGGRGPAADRAVRGAAPGNSGQPARAGLHHGGQPEDRRPGGRGGARGSAGRVVGDRMPADRGGNTTVRRGRLPRAGFTRPRRREPAAAPPPGRAGRDTSADRPVRSG